MAVLLMAGAGMVTMSAEDVTTTYLENPGFEGTYEAGDFAVRNDRAIYVPEGWSVSLDKLDENDMVILKTEDKAANNFSDFFTVNADSRGAQTFWTRLRWGSGQTMKLSQTTKAALPAGVYRLSAEVLKYSTNVNTTMALYAGNKAMSMVPTSASKNDNAWTTASVNFYVENEEPVELGLIVKNYEAVEQIYAIDNLKLEKIADAPSAETPVSMTGLIINPCFDTNTTEGWTYTTGSQNHVIANNKSGDIYGHFFENWNGSAFSGAIEQTIKDLPAGKYRVKLAAFRAGGTGNVVVFANDGETSVTSEDGTFYTAECLVADGTLTLGVKSIDGGCNWMGVDNASLEYLRPLTDAEKLPGYQKALNTAITEAEAKVAFNVGEGVFKYSETGVAELKKALENARNAASSENVTELEAALTALQAAMAAYDESKELTAPAEGDVFNVTITTDDNYKFKDIPLSFNSDGKGGVDLYPANKGMGTAHLATYVTFKKVADKKDCFTMSTVFADGTERFVSTGQTSGNGNSTAQVRLTDDPAKALAVQVIPTATEGVYNLFNTEANNTLGCQDGDDKAKGGLYTTPAHNTFVLTKVDKYTVTLNINEETGYETLILPFKAEIPDGMQVYTVAGTKDATEADDADYVLLELAEVTDGIAANTPYIVKGQGEFKFQGVGAAYGPEYAGERLVGTFVEKEAPAEAFVMDNQGPNFGFYPVTVAEPAEPTDPEPAEPTEPASAPAKAAAANKIVAANHAYMTVPDGETAAAKAYVFVAVPTGVDVIDMTSDELVDVYTLGGVVVRKAVPANEALQGLGKGIYIVGGAKIVK